MTLQVRLQTQVPGSPRHMSYIFTRILQTDGFAGLYNGLSASILRQLTYSTIRFSLYERMKHEVGSDPTLPTLVALATVAGAIGGLAGNFADVVNVRMQNDSALPPRERWNYRHAIDGAMRMAKTEGLSSWLRGWLPNSSRGAMTTAGQLATYDASKKFIMNHTGLEDTTVTQLSASIIAGLTTATITNPIDVLKTKAMSSGGTVSISTLLTHTYQSEGLRWMFKGWLPSFLRQGP